MASVPPIQVTPLAYVRHSVSLSALQLKTINLTFLQRVCLNTVKTMLSLSLLYMQAINASKKFLKNYLQFQ